MNTEQIMEEYETNGRISGKAMTSLRAMLRDSADPYSAITLAGDVGAFQLAEDIVPHLSSDDSMVRWNAAGVLFTRFRDTRFVSLCLEMIDRDSDTMVRGIALSGAGELLALVEDRIVQKELAKRLLQILEAEDAFPEVRGAAYSGIEAAVGLPPIERSPADRLLDPKKDFRQSIIDDFRNKYCL